MAAAASISYDNRHSRCPLKFMMPTGRHRWARTAGRMTTYVVVVRGGCLQCEQGDACRVGKVHI